MELVPYFLKKIISALILPPTGLMLIVILGAALVKKRRTLGLWLISFSTACTLLLSTTGVSGYLLSSLQQSPPVDSRQLQDAEAIVVLAGGIREKSREYGADQPNEFTLERLRYGAWLARRTGLPILVTGGYKYDGPTEAEIMAIVLKEEYGLIARWVESKSRDTADNATLSAKMLRDSKVSRILLVTHAWHMQRALSEFRDTTLVVTPAPTVYASSEPPSSILSFLPNSRSLFESSIALHEWIGLLWARLKGITLGDVKMLGGGDAQSKKPRPV